MNEGEEARTGVGLVVAAVLAVLGAADHREQEVVAWCRARVRMCGRGDARLRIWDSPDLLLLAAAWARSLAAGGAARAGARDAANRAKVTNNPRMLEYRRERDPQ